MMVKRYKQFIRTEGFSCVPYNHSIVLWCVSLASGIAGSHAAYCRGRVSHVSPEVGAGRSGRGDIMVMEKLGDGTYTQTVRPPCGSKRRRVVTAIAQRDIITRYP